MNRSDYRIFTGEFVLTMDDKDTVIENGGVVISMDRIQEVGSADRLLAKYPHAEIISEEHGLIMPGLINSHTHCAMSCFRGLADDLPLMEWLQNYIFPAESRLTGEIVYYATLLSLCEMIRSGTTSFCDMYLFAEDVAKAAEESGMRAWIGEVLYDFPSPNYGEIQNGIKYTEKLFKKYSGHELITITVDPHAVYTCSPELLQRLGRLASDNEALYVIHLSETKDELNSCIERYGQTSVHHLYKLGLLNERVVADHCVVLDDEEIAILADCGVKAVHCAESNLKLASGVAPVPKMLEAGIVVGLGTDGSASNNDVDMFSEMTTVAKIHKLAGMDPTVMGAMTTLRAATRGGAKVLGFDDRIGSLESGKKADFIVLDLNQPHLTPLYNPFSHLVYAARGADVIHSVINGKSVMQDRRITTVDEIAICSRMRSIGEEVRKFIA